MERDSSIECPLKPNSFDTGKERLTSRRHHTTLSGNENSSTERKRRASEASP